MAGKIKHWLPKLKITRADQGYAGKLVAWVREVLKVELEIVKRDDKDKRKAGFEPLPKRWIVERSIGRSLRDETPIGNYGQMRN